MTTRKEAIIQKYGPEKGERIYKKLLSDNARKSYDVRMKKGVPMPTYTREMGNPGRAPSQDRIDLGRALAKVLSKRKKDKDFLSWAVPLWIRTCPWSVYEECHNPSIHGDKLTAPDKRKRFGATPQHVEKARKVVAGEL